MAVSAALLLLLAAAQDPPPAARFAVDGKALASPEATISPLGWLEVTGNEGEEDGKAGGTVLLKLRFPPLAWPTAGERAVPSDAARVFVGTPAREGDSVTGKLEVAEFGLSRVRLQLRHERDGAAHTVEVDLPPKLYVPKLEPTARPYTPPERPPELEDVVVCVLGNTGTGLPGQRQVADSMADLAGPERLDCVVLLGNAFMPDGVASERDPLFESRFERVYDQRRLGVPFFVVPGPAEHRGNVVALDKYGILHPRWTAPAAGFKVELPCRGKTLGLYGCDSVFLAGDVADSRVRSAIRMLVHYVMTSKADWKVVFTHHQLVTLSGDREDPQTELRTERTKTHVTNGGVDLLVSADGRGMRFVQPKDGIPQVMAGGGGGPEMGAVVEEVPGTEFSYGGGGTVWLHCSGDRLSVSFRDAGGKLLYVRDVSKP